jgi:hypothetical protein
MLAVGWVGSRVFARRWAAEEWFEKVHGEDSVVWEIWACLIVAFHAKPNVHVPFEPPANHSHKNQD